MPTYACKLKNAEGKTISANISGGNENDVIRIAEGKNKRGHARAGASTDPLIIKDRHRLT